MCEGVLCGINLRPRSPTDSDLVEVKPRLYFKFADVFFSKISKYFLKIFKYLREPSTSDAKLRVNC